MRLASDGYEGTVTIENREMTVFNLEGIGVVTTSMPSAQNVRVVLSNVALISAFLAGRASRGSSVRSSGGETEAEAEESEVGDGFMASPACGGPPVRLC